MQTAAIRFRVADFLKQYPPFDTMEHTDLLNLAARGRVRFHEAEEYVLWQGAPFGSHVHVIQQGVVSIVEEHEDSVQLRDKLGAGEMFGLERFLGAAACQFSARTETDVVIYALHADDFEPLFAKYPEAERYLAAHASVIAELAAHRPGANRIPIADMVGPQAPLTCDASESIRNALRLLVSNHAAAIGVVRGQSLAGILTGNAILRWIARDGSDLSLPVERLIASPPSVVPPNAVLSDCVLLMTDAGTEAVALTDDGTAAGSLRSIVTASGVSSAIGDDPIDLLTQIAAARDLAALRWLHEQRLAFLSRHLADPSAVEWLAKFAHRLNTAFLERAVDLAGAVSDSDCWCFYGTAGRGELLTGGLPGLALIGAEGASESQIHDRYQAVLGTLLEIGFCRAEKASSEQPPVCRLDQWIARFQEWVENPILSGMYDARPYFDLSFGLGSEITWRELESAIRNLVQANPEFKVLLAHDCLANLPPITFFEDLVIEKSGKQTNTLHLERSAIGPLVDVGRVFAMTAGADSCSTVARYAFAKKVAPQFASIFSDAVESFRVMLYHQARSGLRHRDDGFLLRPSHLNRYEKQVLKTAFRSIQTLIERTAEFGWQELR